MSGNIVIEIDLDSFETTIEGKGYTGSVCSEDIEYLLQNLKGKVIKEELKPEYYDTEPQERLKW